MRTLAPGHRGFSYWTCWHRNLARRLSFVGADDLGPDGAAAGDHAPAVGGTEEQAERRRDPRCHPGSRLPTTRPDQCGGAEPPTRCLQPGWTVPTKTPRNVALGRTTPV